MILPSQHWIPFANDAEQLVYQREHQLASKTAAAPKQLYYRGYLAPEMTPCEIVGYDGIMAVIRLGDALHCVHPDYLREMQPTKNELASFVGPAVSASAVLHAEEALQPGEAAPEDAPAVPPSPGKLVSRSVSRYTVIDLETTGLEATSDEIIELAAVRVRDGRIVDTFARLVRPSVPLSPIITAITGIQEQELSDAKPLSELLPDYLDFLGTDILVGHNVKFDADFLTHACERLFHHTLPKDRIDTIRFCRERMSLSSYKLSSVREALELPEHPAHRALSDCIATMEVYEALRKLPKRRRTPKQGGYTGHFRAAPLERHPELYPDEIVTGEASPFQGKTCVLTGELHISREEATAMIETAGGTVKSGVSRKTDYLIVGQQDKTLVGEDGLSSKEEKAIALNQSGKAQIKILTEAQLCAMLSKEGVPCG